MRNPCNDEPVVITGIGPVTAIGIGFAEFAKAITAERSSIAEVTGFDVENCRCKLAAEIVDFDVRKFLTSEKGYLDRNSALALAAARLALDDAGLKISPESATEVGLCLGTCFGNAETARAFYQKMREKGPKLAPPFIFPHTYTNTTASLLAIEWGIKGVHANFSSGAAAGAEAIAYAVCNLRAGRAGAILAGGVEAISQPVFKALDSAGKLNPSATAEKVEFPINPQSSDAGFILGEGAGLLVMEAESRAKGRGARIQARLVGLGVAGDCATAMTAALQDAGLTAGDVGLVASACNGTLATDLAEARALREIFAGKDVRIVYGKSLVGETVGASGPLSVAAAVAGLRSESVAAKAEYALVNAIEPGALAISFVLKL
jgi:3-oxoacyl-[acyl-carrier-protein] synthase II